MFKIKNKDTRRTPMASVCIFNFQQLNTGRVHSFIDGHL